MQSTLCFPVRGDFIFLSRKKKGFGAGWLNGYGGKVQEGEQVEEAARRELREESGILASPADLEKVAVIDFFDGDRHIFECHAFFISQWSGEFQESEEMAYPESYNRLQLPLDQMWKADKEWLPLICAGKKIRGTAIYKPGMAEFESFRYQSLSEQE
jgi:8-oxo-dGTP diphosphatase